MLVEWNNTYKIRFIRTVYKGHYYQPNNFKVVTGVGIKHGKMVEHIIKLYAECKKDSNIYEIKKLNGILCSLRQIKLDIFSEIYSYVQHYEQELRNLSKKRFYKYQRRCAT